MYGTFRPVTNGPQVPTMDVEIKEHGGSDLGGSIRSP